jgi:hypothetical protein
MGLRRIGSLVPAPDDDFSMQLNAEAISHAPDDLTHETDDIASGRAIVGHNEVGVTLAHARAADAQALEPRAVDQEAGTDARAGCKSFPIACDEVGREGWVLEAAASGVVGHRLALALEGHDFFEACAKGRGIGAGLEGQVNSGDDRGIGPCESALAVSERKVTALDHDLMAIARECMDALDDVADLAEGAAGIHHDRAADAGGDASEPFEAREAVLSNFVDELWQIDARTNVHATAGPDSSLWCDGREPVCE